MRAIVFKSIGTALLALTLVFALTLTHPWHALELKTFDLWSLLAAPGKSHRPIAILAIDEPSFQQLSHANATQWIAVQALLQRLAHAAGGDWPGTIALDKL